MWDGSQTEESVDWWDLPVSRDEHVFRDEGEADRFEALLASTMKRDDFQILAWCVMSNHYHLAVRSNEDRR